LDKNTHNKASQFASKLAGLVSLAFAGRRYMLKAIYIRARHF